MTHNRSFRHKLLIGASLSAMLLTSVAQAQSQGGWNRGRGAGADPSATAARAAQDEALRQTQTNSQTQRALEAFRRQAQIRTQMQDAQLQARIAAQQVNVVPNGLTPGGLVQAPEIEIDPSLWVGADRTIGEEAKGDRTAVTVTQTEQKAILTWDSFNVGTKTDLTFRQDAADWVVLNRVRDVNPSLIHGSVNAKGTVLILNQNGMLFGGASTVNVRNLIASSANITDADFLNPQRGIYSQLSGTTYLPSFTGAQGAITLEAGAQIKTHGPESVTQGGGYVMLLGTEVTNAGSILTPKGQALLSAGDDFIVRRGFGSEENQFSTTRGNEVRGLIGAESTSGPNTGTVINRGLIEATEGDITLAGRTIRQDGVALATTSVVQRGTIHLLNSASDAEGSVTLGKGWELKDVDGKLVGSGEGLTIVAPEVRRDADGNILPYDAKLDQRALDAQRDTLIKNSGEANLGRQTTTTGGFDDRSLLADFQHLSRIEIVTGGDVTFEGGSNTSAQGGQVAVQANKGRITVEDGARIDVSGVQGIALDMESNSILVNVQGNELRDSPLNRDNDRLKSQDVWVDVRDLILVPDGTGGYKGDRYYTPGGLLEVGGYLGNQGHTIGEWSSSGGTITLAAKEIVAQQGATFDLSGGSLDYQAGWVLSTRVLGEDGKLYDLSNAPADIKMLAWGDAFVRKHDRWGEQYTQVWSHPIGGARNSRRWSDGYSVGRSAGQLVLTANTAIMDADIISETVQGERQTLKPVDGIDGYDQVQNAAPKGAALIVGAYNPVYDSELKRVRAVVDPSTMSRIVVGDNATTSTFAPGEALPEDMAGTLLLDSDRLNAMKLGTIHLVAKDGVEVNGDLAVTAGGKIALHAAAVDVNADLTAESGMINLGNIRETWSVSLGHNDGVIAGADIDAEYVKVAEGVTLDASGRWTNMAQDGARPGDMAWRDGGDVKVRSRGAVTLEQGSLVDVTSGAFLTVAGDLFGGRGGDVTLAAGVMGETAAPLVLDGKIEGYGVNGGGKLAIESGTAVGIGSGFLDKDGVLKAGQEVKLGLTTLEDVEVGLGEKLPASYSFESTRIKSGEIFQSGFSFKEFSDELSEPITLIGDWELPPSTDGYWGYYIYATDLDGNEHYFATGYESTPSLTVPKGWTITRIRNSFYFPTGIYVIPEGVFPGSGILVSPYKKTIEEGAILTQEILNDVGAERLTFASGLTLAAGSVLKQDVAVRPILELDPALMRSGFSDYRIAGAQGIAVNDGVAVSVEMPVLRQSERAGVEALDRSFELWTPPAYLEDAARGRMSQRGGASLTLSAGGGSSYLARPGSAAAWVRKGASVMVDPGQSITIESVGQLTVDGDLTAKAGTVRLLETGVLGTGNNQAAHSLSITVRGTIDVSGVAHVAYSASGLDYGLIRDAGTITIGGTINEDKGSVDAGHLFVRIEDSARLDARGVTAAFSVPGSNASRHDSNGGTISLVSNSGLIVDGDILLGGGGASAAGGWLAVGLGSPEYRTDSTGLAALLTPREMIIRQGAIDRTEDAALAYGDARLSADRLMKTGADNISLLSDGVISFDDSVSLTARQSVRLYASSLSLSRSADADTDVLISAPYVRLAGATGPLGGDGFAGAWIRGTGRSSEAPSGSFKASANLIDVRDQLTFGAKSTISATGVSVERRGFALAELESQGDLRFLKGSVPMGGNYLTELRAPGDLILTARQVYPGSNVAARVFAGFGAEEIEEGGSMRGYDPNTTLTIRRPAGVAANDLPTTPLSAFGRLTLGGYRVDQQGVVRAPLGLIELGTHLGEDGVQGFTKHVNLHAGSITSASGAGLTLPYGGTVDGIRYLYDGADVLLVPGSQTRGGSGNAGDDTGIDLSGIDINVREGATLDLSGGGDLLGAGFISGRGGSTDARLFPLMQIGADGRAQFPGNATNQIYAIVPELNGTPAPIGGEVGANSPLVGQTIKLDGSIPGLPAGTYTLLPSSYALLPGAFRVEIDGASGAIGSSAPVALPNGSWSANGRLGIANTPVLENVGRSVILTSADTLRTYAQYDETSYAEFVLADAIRRGVPRALLPADARTLHLSFSEGHASNRQKSSFNFDGKALFEASKDGRGGTLSLAHNAFAETRQIEILADGTEAQNDSGASIYASDLNAVGASRILFGKLGGNYESFASQITINSGANYITLRSGAELRAAEVILSVGSSGHSDSAIVVEAGAGIRTIGFGESPIDLNDGYYYTGYERNSTLVVSNGWIDLQPPALADRPGDTGRFEIGACTATIDCSKAAYLYSDGTIGIATNKPLEIAETARYGTENLVLSVAAFNVGTTEALNAARDKGVLPEGMALNQDLLDRLLRGDQQFGAPALKTLALSASSGINFFETVTLSTLDAATGKSTLTNLALTAPSISGYGDANDVALIQTGNLIWNGSTARPQGVIPGGAGTGSGRFEVQAETVQFGYADRSQPDPLSKRDRLILGFADVALNASKEVTANYKGSLSVYQSQGAYVEGKGFQYSGGNLHITTPLLTSEAGAELAIKAGGSVRIDGGLTGDAVPTANALGGKLSIEGQSLALDTAVVLPSGKLSLIAQDDLVLGDLAQIDMSGRTIKMFDVTQYSWGGDVTLESREGDIRQAAGSTINLSAENNRGGLLTAIALNEAAGLVDLGGSILGKSGGAYDAGGTMVPYLAGGVEVRAQTLGATGTLDQQFAALNQRLNTGEVFGSRSFQVKQGNLTIGNDVRASIVDISLDGGSLTVDGLIDASGERVGQIRLAGKQGLTLTGNAVLDAHGRTLRLDSYEKIIDSPNRAIVELTSGEGTLTLNSKATIDLRHGTDDPRVAATPSLHDGRAQGTLVLNAPRVGSTGSIHDSDAATYGDVAIRTEAGLDIRGAKSIAVNAVQRYDDAPLFDGSDHVNGRPYQVIDQAYLDGKHGDSTAFIDAALGNSNLLNTRLAGLNNASYLDVLHLRPGVDIVTASQDTDLIVQGDLDLSGYRYDSLNPAMKANCVLGATPGDAGYGSGEPGALTMRAGGNLEIYGSITDGFVPVDIAVDTGGWVLINGVQPFGSDVVIPRNGVALQKGTLFPSGVALNYDLPADAAELPAGLVVPSTVVLGRDHDFPAGTVFANTVTGVGPDGTEYTAQPGQALPHSLTLADGTRLDAGTRLSIAVRVKSFIWPEGEPLPIAMALSERLELKIGALIPKGADIRLDLPEGQTELSLRDAGSRNWSIAPMLPAGAQSWSIGLIAGADLNAADFTSVHPMRNGNLIFSDPHYNLDSQVIWHPEIPGQPGSPGGWFKTWAPGAADYIGDPSIVAGDPIIDEFEFDPSASICDAATWGAELCGPEIYIEPKAPVEGKPAWAQRSALYQLFSVIRTGTGDLAVAAAGDVALRSPYGAYTAGTDSLREGLFSGSDFYQNRGKSTDDGSLLGSEGSAYEALATSLYRAWYPEQGGNVSIRAGGDLTGFLHGAPEMAIRTPLSSAAVGNWLWRQGTGTSSGADPIPTAWWINFGAYTTDAYVDSSRPERRHPYVTGFTGIGTLGGGNIDIRVGGDAGSVPALSSASLSSTALNIAVGGTGRVLLDGGDMKLTGGGDIRLQAGGQINALVSGGEKPSERRRQDLHGAVTNLRGHVSLTSQGIGGIALLYPPMGAAIGDVRVADIYRARHADARGGLMVVPGDSVIDIGVAGDLVLGAAADPGRVPIRNATPFKVNGVEYQGGFTGFSLWTDHTAINLFSAGGNVTPSTQIGETHPTRSDLLSGRDYSPTDGRIVYPARFAAVAASGDIFMGRSALGASSIGDYTQYSMLLAPHRDGDGYLSLLAGNSLFGGVYPISRSGAEIEATSSPLRPAFLGVQNNSIANALATTYSSEGIAPAGLDTFPLFAFNGSNSRSPSLVIANPGDFYAVKGDVIGLVTGQKIEFRLSSGRPNAVWHEAAGPVRIRAGGDIVGSGNRLGTSTPVPDVVGGRGIGTAGTATGNLIVHGRESDVSVVSAGGDIIYSAFQIAGPGTLEMTAGGDIRMDDQVQVLSIGPVTASDNRPGASIVMQAGMTDVNWNAVRDIYLDPHNRADPEFPLSHQNNDGKVAHTYDSELSKWLKERFGFAGTGEEAFTYFSALAPEQQRVFLRSVYFTEIREAGREYNDADGPRPGTYRRGQQMIATLFPDAEAREAGNVLREIEQEDGSFLRFLGARTGTEKATLEETAHLIERTGSITMFGAAGVHTQRGGGIQMLTPGGRQVFGTEGVPPPGTAGIITQGQGDIELYAQGSILLGLSRIMTTFGGNILGWSAAGDINAGRGAKTTIVYTPPLRVYDEHGNVRLSSDTPSTGAGIATLNPIAEVAPGDIDLIAPLGTIDAGEAGIRVSGNINLAALQVLNAANIKVQGEASGIPVVAAVNTGALTAASSATSAIANEAAQLAERARPQVQPEIPTILNVRFLGFGD